MKLCFPPGNKIVLLSLSNCSQALLQVPLYDKLHVNNIHFIKSLLKPMEQPGRRAAHKE